MEADVHGDCDTQQTELRKRGKGSPWKVVFHSDNVQRRMPFFPFCNLRVPWSVRAEFAEASLAMFSVGHTHHRLDQRFSVIGNLLSRATRLETPQDYIMHKSARGIPVFFLKKLEAPTIGANSLHPWKSISKESLDLRTQLMVRMCCALPAETGRCAPEADWAEDGHPEDLALLAKHWLHSKALSQLWATIWQWDFRNLEVAPRMVLNDESRKQYQKTADQILAKPWNVQSAATYILGWLQRNQSLSVNVSTVPEITFLMEGKDFLPAAAVAGSTWKDFACEDAVFIETVRRPERQILEQARKRQRSRDVPQLAVMPRRARVVMNAAQSRSCRG